MLCRKKQWSWGVFFGVSWYCLWKIVVGWSGFLVVVYFCWMSFWRNVSDIKSSHLVKCFGSKIIWRDSGKDRFFNFIMEWLRAREFNPQITWSMYGIFTYSWLKFYGKCRWTYHTWILWVTFQQGKYVGQTCVHPYHSWSGKIYIQMYTKTYLKPHISSISQCLPLSLSLSLYIYMYIWLYRA